MGSGVGWVGDGMNRRKFFNSFGVLIGAASLSPSIFIPKFEPVKWKVQTKEICVINPDWLNAPYEIYFRTMKGMDRVYERAWHPSKELVTEPHLFEMVPMRFYDLSDTTKVVPPYIIQRIKY